MKKEQSKLGLCLTLFTAFAKIGAFTFGGGYAMLPMLKRECVEHYGWTDEEEIIDVFAIGQCTPGVIAVNTATYIGYRTAGDLGAIAATLGVVFPSMVIIMSLAAALSFVMDYPMVQHALNGVRVCVCVLVANAILGLAKKALVDKFAIVMYAVVLALALFTNISTGTLVICSGLVGLAALFIAGLKGAKKKEER